MTQPKWWDATFPANQWTMHEIVEISKELCDRFVVGRERGEGGYDHFQFRGVFKCPKEIATLTNQYGMKRDVKWAHWSPTHVRDFKYCEKEGNFYRSWEGPLAKYCDVVLRPWQEDFVEKFSLNGPRDVIVVYDPVGNSGKTYVSKYMQVTRRAQYVPPMGDAQDLMAFALEKQASGYIFDMPRSESIKQKKGMWSAVEQIKNGYLYDKRYKYRDAWTEPPRVAVFCNELPDPDVLSGDRWQVYQLNRYLGEVRGLQRMEPYETETGWEWAVVSA